MQTKIIEAQSEQGNWGKFMLGQFDSEWSRYPTIEPLEQEMGDRFAQMAVRHARKRPLLQSIGVGREALLVFDLQTGEGALFYPGGFAEADLKKHRIWVCPLFEPFLIWLYREFAERPELTEIALLPDLVRLDAPLELAGHRRPGLSQAGL